MFKAVLFDLDGTITDSAEGITKSVQYALEHFGIQVSDPKKLTCFVGPSLYEQFQRYANMTPQQANFAVEKFRERFASVGIFENALYEGIENVLKELKKQGVVLAIASAKPQVFVHQVLLHFGIEHYFDIVVGSELDGTRSQKEEVIEVVLDRLQYQVDPSQVLMVGDRLHDIYGAIDCGITSCGVAYGYGGRDELIKAGANYIVNSVEELQHFFTTNPTPVKREEIYELKAKRENIVLKIWKSLYPIGIHFAGAIVASFFGTLIIMTVVLTNNPGISQTALENEVLHHSLLLTFIGQLMAFPLLAYFFRKDMLKRTGKRNIAIFVEIKKFTPIQWIAMYAFAACLGLGLSNLIDIVGIPRLFPAYSELTEKVFQNQNIILSIVTVGIFAPIVEELAFRGLMYRRIKDYAGIKWGVLLSSLAFGIYHGNMVQFIFAFLLGMVIAIAYEKGKTLWVPIMLHMGVNLTSTLLSEFFPGYGNLLIFLVVTIVEIGVAIILGKYLWNLVKKN